MFGCEVQHAGHEGMCTAALKKGKLSCGACTALFGSSLGQMYAIVGVGKLCTPTHCTGSQELGLRLWYPIAAQPRALSGRGSGACFCGVQRVAEESSSGLTAVVVKEGLG